MIEILGRTTRRWWRWYLNSLARLGTLEAATAADMYIPLPIHDDLTATT